MSGMVIDLENAGFVHFVADALSASSAETSAERAVVYQELRQSVERRGVKGLRTDDALRQLEAAILRQDCFRDYFDHLASVEDFDDMPELILDSAGAIRSEPWYRRLKDWFSGARPTACGGPEPGPANGPYSDDCFASVEVFQGQRRAKCRIWYRYDPACVLQAEIDGDEGIAPFQFQTRAWGFRYAVEHLGHALSAVELQTRCAACVTDARWEGEGRDAEGVLLPGASVPVHAFERIAA